MSRSGSPYSTPRDANRVPLLVAASTADGVTPVVLEADPTTHLLQVSSSGGGGGTVAQGTAAAVSAGWPVIGGELADTTGTFTNATQTTSVTTTNFDGYSAVIVSISGTYGTASGIFEISDDNGTTWYTVNAARTDGTAIETGYTSLTNTNRMWTLSVSGADQFRVRSTAVASGTVNVRISIESMPTPEAASVTTYQGGSWIVGSSATTGAAVPTTAFLVGAKDGSANLQPLSTSNNVSDAGGSTSLATTTGYYNGSNYDRGRSIVNGTNSTGTGIGAVGIIGQFDDVSPTAITENQFGNLRISGNRNLYATIRDAAGNERGANVTASNELVVSDSGLRPASTSLNTFSIHLTSNTTTTPIASTAYISSISVSNEVAGTTSTITIQDKQGTPLKLVNGIATTALTTIPTIINFQTPVKMVSGIDIITAGAVAATVDVWVNYYA